MIGLWDDASSEVFGPMSNAKRKNILVYYRILLLFETVWFLGLQSRDQASMLVNKWFFFAEVFTEFVQKHNYVSRGGRDFCSLIPAWPPWGQLQTSDTTNISSSRKYFWNVPCKTRTSAMAKTGYSFWFLCLTSPYNFKPRVSCGIVVLQYDI